jgi:hypothetical protein
LVRAFRCASTSARKRLRIRFASAASVVDSERYSLLAGQRVEAGVDEHLQGVAALADRSTLAPRASVFRHGGSTLAVSVIDSDRLTGVRRLHNSRSEWSRRGDSNPEPTAYKAVALPVELRRRV